MRKEPDRQAVLAMQQAGCSIRKIARLMKMSRKTVRRILAGKHQPGIERPSRYESLAPLVCELFTRYEGNVVLVGQQLKDEYGHDVPYPSLTRLVRQLQLREPENKRSGSFQYPPGKEAQHDTSPHRLILGGKSVKAQCAAMALASSRLLYAQYYPRFTRFEAKIFISQALDYFGGAPRICIIDNTSVIVASGSGGDAVMAPEMEAFGGIYGMRFQAHEIGHCDRKAIIERNFRYIEKNFLPGRQFTDWQQVNRQVKDWCSQIANNKIKRALAMTPRQAYATEKPWLQPLPAFRPPIYQSLTRVVDLSGFVTVDTNRYSVPERFCGKVVDIHKGAATIRLFRKHKKIANHERLIGRRDAKITAPGHHLPPQRRTQKGNADKHRRILLGHNHALDQYVNRLKVVARSSATRKMQRLINFKQTYPKAAFDKAVERALQYGLYDLNRLENLILSFVAGDFFNLNDHDH